MERGGGPETGKRMGTAEYTAGNDRKGRPEEEEEKKTRKNDNIQCEEREGFDAVFVEKDLTCLWTSPRIGRRLADKRKDFGSTK